jgi:hypothetical protein
MSKVIISCFAGRRRYMKILSSYIGTLMDRDLVDEFHLWDFSWEIEDAKYLEEISNSNQKFVLFRPKKDTWGDYYSYYTTERYPDPDTVIIKCDDDIIFIDVNSFSQFITTRRTDKHSLLHSASVINGSVTSLVQHKMNVLPFKEDELLHVLHSNTVPELIHSYFLSSHETIIAKSAALEQPLFLIDVNYPTQLSINFIAILAKDLDIFKTEGIEIRDEEVLSLKVPPALNRPNAVNTGFIVSHAAFLGQRRAGFDDAVFVERYLRLVPSRSNINRFEEFNYLMTKFTPIELEPLVNEIRDIEKANFLVDGNGAASLAGHLKKQFFLKCKDYIENIVIPHVNHYEKENPMKYKFDFFKDGVGDYYLDSLWVNFQEKYEFNPVHDHNGVLSFVIWIQIPYDLNTEFEMFPNSNRKRTSIFEFVVPSHRVNSNVCTIPILVDKTYEGTMVLFPSSASHTVYPFYTSDGYRISVAGNFKFK